MQLKHIKLIISAAAAVSVLLSVSLSSYAEEPVADQSECCGGGAAVMGKLDNEGFAAQLYDAENGLPTSDANVILASSDGFIWIGGYSGLIRYDGTTFERQDSSGGITNVNSLLEDSKGRLWVGTNDNGVVVVDKDSSRHYTYLDGLRSSSIRAMCEDSEGNIIVGTTQGMCYIDHEDLEFHNLVDHQLDNLYIQKLCRDDSGIIYGCTKDGAFFRIRDLRLAGYYNGSELGIGDVTTIYADPNAKGSVYLGTHSGSVCHGSFEKNFPDIEKTSIYYDKKVFLTDDLGNIVGATTEHAVSTRPVNCINYMCGTIWVIADDMIFYRGDDGNYVKLDNIPLTSSIESAAEDYEGNVWFTSSRQGIMKIVSNKFSDVTARAGLEERVVNTTCLHGGLLYIGTDSGLQITDSSYLKVENELTEMLGTTRIRCIMEDSAGNLWISTYNDDMGLICLTADNSIVQYTEKDGLLSNKTRCTVPGPGGSVLVATNGGLSVIENGKITRGIGSDSGLNNTVILTAAASDDGKYYLGTDGDGIYVIDGNRITRLGREDGLTSEIILRIKRDDPRGVYWIITSNSIQYIKDGVIHEVSGNFPYTNNYDIFFDKTGNAWVLSSNGIFVVKADELLGSGVSDYMHYGISDGLPGVPTGNSFSCITDGGDLYISGRKGVCHVNIDRYFDKSHDIRFSIPFIESNDVKYYPDANGKINLPSSANNITIYGYALTYSMHDPQIEYYLHGSDERATVVRKSEMKPVRYTNLKGGTYTYELSLINSSTHDIQQTMTVTVNKEMAFYEQVWFYVVCIVLGLIVIGIVVSLYIGYRTKAFREKERENKIFIRDMCEAFAKTIDVKDKYTNGHSKRVAHYTSMLTKELGYGEDVVEKYYNIALLHDIGKIGVPMEVLNKPGKLTDEEFGIIKSHTTIGYNVLKDISIMPELATGAGAHHERPDGRGYPNGLKGEEIPRVAQIIAVADTFDAMYSNRPYRKRMNFEKVCSIIKEVSGTQLEPDVVDAFMRLVDKGEFRAPNDHGGGSMDDINNIHKSFEKDSGQPSAEQKPVEQKPVEQKPDEQKPAEQKQDE